MKSTLWSLSILLVLAACSSVPPEEAPSEAVPAAERGPLVVPPLSSMRQTPPRSLAGRYTAVPWSSLPAWNEDDLARAWQALIEDCRGLMRPISGALTAPARATPQVWQPVCAAAAQMDANGTPSAVAMRQFLQARLQPWRLDQGPGRVAQGRVTGYYEPLIHASRKRGGDYQWPLYARPDDLLTIDLGAVYPELAGKRIRGKLEGHRVVPYDTRAQLEADPARRPPVIVWANDPVEAFFLQVQGSGRAVLPDGRVIRLAYADHNGQPYVSIGQWLAKQGEMPLAQASMQNIKRWAHRHPSRVQALLNVNPAMVFFREEAIVDPALGPRGAYGIPLTPGRSIAVDSRYVPLGTPVFLSTQWPGAAKPLRRLVFALDTGAAIQGPARVDFYWGTGDEAGALAGRMKQTGEVWLLWPQRAGAPSAR